MSDKCKVNGIVVTESVAKYARLIADTAAAGAERTVIQRRFLLHRDGTNSNSDTSGKAYAKLQKIGAITRTPEVITIIDLDLLRAVGNCFTSTTPPQA